MATRSQPNVYPDAAGVRAYSAEATRVQEEDTDLPTDIEGLAPRFEALGLGEIAARLRALLEPPAPEASPRVALSPHLEEQLLSILSDFEF
jgi:hypothetical protein